MQSKGGGKHDILSVGRATATTLNCLWMRPRDPDADMCPGTETAPVSTEECMAHQSCVSATGYDGGHFATFATFAGGPSAISITPPTLAARPHGGACHQFWLHR
jgi:hypothetical protein